MRQSTIESYSGVESTGAGSFLIRSFTPAFPVKRTRKLDT